MESYQALPEHIRDWASSEGTTFLIAAINNRLGLKNEKRRTIPSLILRLIIQNLEPQDFINELADKLNISFQTAKSIAEDIEGQVLHSVENELRRDVGVDIKLIRFGQPRAPKPIVPSPEITALPAPLSLKTTPFLAPQSSKTAETWTTRSATDIVTTQKSSKDFLQIEPSEKPATTIEETLPVAPFLLHKESSILQTQTPAAQPLARAKTNFTIPVPIYQKTISEKPAVPKSVSVKIELPDQPVDKPLTEPKAARIVHYSELRTPLTPAGTQKASLPPENTIDLRKFAEQPSYKKENEVDLKNK